MEGHHAMAALPTWNANVTDDAANSSTGNQHSCTLAPDFIELVEESVVILDLAELALILFIFFQRPIGRRRHNQMHAPIWNPREVARIAES